MRRWTVKIGLTILALWLLLFSAAVLTRPGAPFKFVEGHKPLTFSKEERASMLRDESGWLFYSWEGDYAEVKQSATNELLENGYHVGSDQPGYVHFLRNPVDAGMWGDRVVIEANSGRPFNLPYSNRPGWVGVAIQQEADRGFLARLRAWLGL